MIRALLLTHGRLGHELCRVVELFLGPVEGLEAVSNAGLSAHDLAAAVRRWLDSPNEITADATDAADGSDPSRPSVTAGEDTRSPEAPTAASDPAARNRSVPPALILVDEHGGSCATAARLVAGDYPDVRILCGVNLAMLLGFVSWRENLELPDLVRRLINTGRDAIVEAVIDR